MRLGTLIVLGLLAFGGVYVARNADDWVNRLKREKAEVAAALNKRLESEKAKAAAALNKRIESEKEKAAAALKERLDSERERAAVRAAAERRATEKEKLPAAVAPGLPQTGAAPQAMNEAAFWRLIAESRMAAGNDTGRQSELLKARLTQVSPQAIVDFARIRRRLDERAYTNDLWGAASVIEDGCSDDCFRDFRGYLISLGQGPYENALRNPDSLASFAQDAGTGEWANAANVAPDAYSIVTGANFPLDQSEPSGSPRGAPFNGSDSGALARRYPRLAARFR